MRRAAVNGQPPDREGLKWFNHAWDALERDSVPPPFIYPSEDGGIQLEWTVNDWVVSAEVDLATKLASMFPSSPPLWISPRR